MLIETKLNGYLQKILMMDG